MILRHGAIYEQGYEAFYEGYDISENPFDSHSDEFVDWQAGWEDAEWDRDDAADDGYYCNCGCMDEGDFD